MNFASSIASVVVVTMILVLSAAAMMFSHWRLWQTVQKEEVSEDELEYRRRQYRRRMQTSAMLGVLGLAIFVGYVLTVWLNSPVFTLICWGTIILVLFWTCLLALADIWATKIHFSRMRDHCLVEQARLRAELNRIQEQSYRGNGNGKHPTQEPTKHE